MGRYPLHVELLQKMCWAHVREGSCRLAFSSPIEFSPEFSSARENNNFLNVLIQPVLEDTMSPYQVKLLGTTANNCKTSPPVEQSYFATSSPDLSIVQLFHGTDRP